jgi:hypothetical protein
MSHAVPMFKRYGSLFVYREFSLPIVTCRGANCVCVTRTLAQIWLVSIHEIFDLIEQFSPGRLHICCQQTPNCNVKAPSCNSFKTSPMLFTSPPSPL